MDIEFVWNKLVLKSIYFVGVKYVKWFSSEVGGGGGGAVAVFEIVELSEMDQVLFWLDSFKAVNINDIKIKIRGYSVKFANSNGNER